MSTCGQLSMPLRPMHCAQWSETIEGDVGNSETCVKSTKPVSLYHIGLHTEKIKIKLKHCNIFVHNL